MTIFQNYRMTANHKYMRLSAEPLFLYDNGSDEKVTLGTPKCWDDLLIESIGNKHYDIYAMYVRSIDHGKHNRLTDYKKIWGLRKVDCGQFDGFYDTDRARVYVGFSKLKSISEYGECRSAYMVLSPDKYNFPYASLFEEIKDNTYDFCIIDQTNGLFRISNKFPELVFVRYHIAEQVTMEIYGDIVDDMIKSVNCNMWENVKTLPVFRE